MLKHETTISFGKSQEIQLLNQLLANFDVFYVAALRRAVQRRLHLFERQQPGVFPCVAPEQN